MHPSEAPPTTIPDADDDFPGARAPLPLEQLESHARQLAVEHRETGGGGPRRELLARLDRNADRLENIYKKLSEEGFTSKPETPSEEWLRDNHYVVRVQLLEIRRNLPRKYYEELPTLTAGRWRRYPRVYVFARNFVTHTAGRFDQESLRRFADAYQDVTPLTIGELWAIPIMLRLALVENLCGLAVGTLRAKQEREAARKFAAKLLSLPDKTQPPLHLAAKTSATFVVEILHNLRDQSVASTTAWRWLQTRLGARGQSPDEVLRLEQHREAIDQLSIANIITTMRVLSALDWPAFVEGVSRVERILRRDPAGAYADMDQPTRDRYRKSVEQLSRRSGADELDVAERAVRLAETAQREHPDADRRHHVGYYLISRGRFELERALRYFPTVPERLSRLIFKHPAISYLGSVALTTVVFEASLLIYARNSGASVPMMLLVALVTILPVSELALSFLNTILTTIIPPRPLPKLALRHGIPDHLRTIVAVPTILSSEGRIRELVDALEVRSLANHDDNLRFALLSDFVDADSETLPDDKALVELAIELITTLNVQHGAERFYLLHRNRRWNASEGKWMGWERKRGKLHELNRLLRGAQDTSFAVQIGNVDLLQSMRYVITLDSDTDLPLDVGLKLVGTLAHPLNRARFDAISGRVTEGYSVLQPRVAIGAVSASATSFSEVFSGHVGIDPYTSAVSDVYQDLFGEGSYVGKGIYDIDAFERALQNRVPENALLSHDLFEGLFARVALCTDVEVIDDFPTHYVTWIARLHRWVRGDWQLVPWLGGKAMLPAIARWKIFDNLRRSLLPPALVALLAAGWLVLPGGPSLWTGTAFLVLFFPAYVQWGQTFTNRARGVRFRDHLRAEQANLLASLHQVLLTSAFLLHQSAVMVDAIGRTLMRLFTKKHLLEWVTAADSAERLSGERANVLRHMWSAPVLAFALALAVAVLAPASLGWAVPVVVLWGSSPFLAYETGLPREDRRRSLDTRDRRQFRKVARLTWRFFEELLTPGDNWLVPDNYQEGRSDPIAHRTSPTNIGLQMMAIVSAWDLGYISRTQCLTRLERTFESLLRLPKYRGHLFNWYDTQSLVPLAPLYVSTVDSGNLLGYLLTLKAALAAMVEEPPVIDRRVQEGLCDTIDAFEREGAAPLATLGREAARDLRNDLRRLRIELDALPTTVESSAKWLLRISDELAVLASRVHDAEDRMPASASQLASAAWWLDAAASIITEQRRELAAMSKAPDDTREALRGTAHRLAAAADAFAEETELEFLFDRQRHLFAIGYNVTEGRRDSTFYDALASEARLASFIAIAMRHVSQEHWFKLGRLMTPVGPHRALVSWSASMFEYLMPLLIMRTYPRTLLNETYEAVVTRHIEYASRLGVPWGISESAYNVQDTAGNYQYRAFGVPGIGLKRGLADDLVVAPYASLLAAPFRPREVLANLEYLDSEGALGPMGYYEAIDYTSDRVEPGERRAVIRTYMAHHHGMSLVALNNCLNGNIMQARFHAEPRVQAAELLLQERSPHLVPLDRPPEEHKVQEAPGRVAQALVRRYVTPHTVTPRAHVLSNGSMSVMVTNSGGGYTRWRDVAVTRWREDATCDGWGSFCYIRDVETLAFWSAGFQPSGREADSYEVTFAPDRAVIRRRDEDIETFTEVTVSPEDDAEIRRVSVTNHSRVLRELELTSYMEVVLAPQASDVAHPVFSNLFIATMRVPEHQAILCARRPRSRERRLYMGHVLASRGRIGEEVQFETDREHFVGRGGTIGSPVALMADKPLSGATGAVLDPIASLRVRVKVPPGVTVRLSFATVVGENEDGVRALIEKYHDPQVSARAFALASTHSEIELRYLGVSREDEARYQRLAARVIYADPRLRSPEAVLRNTGTPPDLWKYGISGDLPIVLVTVADGGEVGLAKELLRGQEYLRARGFVFDLVILNELPTSYRQDVQDELQRMAESGPSHAWIDRPGGLFLRRADSMTEPDRVLLRAVARAIFEGSRGGFEVQLRRPLLPPVPPRPLVTVTKKPQAGARDSAGGDRASLAFFNGYGGFTQDGREYHVSARPPAPWSNIVANAQFGFVATESSLGNTWSQNSYQNRLTPWNNDPIVDPPGEVVYVREDTSGEFWSATASPAGRGIAYNARFGQGYVVYEHTHRKLAIDLSVFVPVNDPVKVLRLRVRNEGSEPRELSICYYVDWCLSDNRSRSAAHIFTSIDQVCGALFARNAFRAGFGQRVAFLDTSSSTRTITGDRTSFIGRNGTLRDPSAMRFAHLPGRVGAGLDPCGAIQANVIVPVGETTEVTFVLGDGAEEGAARELVAKYRASGAVDAEFDRVRQLWNERLGAVEVRTPDRALDVLTNRWLAYQTLSCRFHARSAFYQSGGAFGFRDQLQDVLSLLHCEPGIAREHILRAAGRQFAEGDAQHWWHEPFGEGVRTRIQDDRLWLVYATLHYARVTGDWDILDVKAPLIDQRAPGPDEHSVYERPVVLPVEISLYEHCVRAIGRSLDTGAHGLPLMGTGDWNDGMDEVGAHGQGESVWLGWFLASLLSPFAAIMEARGDIQHATLYRAHAARLVHALEESWDGEWYRRAYFDDGTPLGSSRNAECRIDSIAQSWSVISGLGNTERARQAMQSVDRWLVDRDARLVLLLTPPFDKAEPTPGYIRGYVPGVRENGGQYTHAALWVVLAQALLGRGDAAHELLSFINPINRTADLDRTKVYRVEPYAVAADIYSAPGHVGRGGWTWYTGAAGWMYRVTIEHILGIRREGEWLLINPCVPAEWPEYQVTLRIPGAEYRIEVENPEKTGCGVRAVELDGQPVDAQRVRLEPSSGPHVVRVRLG
ncbi:MAG TPA: glucoamylase family protein [Vicinamibacterales bacterium]|nr:glucoamylase family protein [Vicinamibacterales bacterium]